jgi:hypothetical protein
MGPPAGRRVHDDVVRACRGLSHAVRTRRVPFADLAYTWDVPAVDLDLSVAVACRDCGWAQAVNESRHEGRLLAWRAAHPEQDSDHLAGRDPKMRLEIPDHVLWLDNGLGGLALADERTGGLRDSYNLWVPITLSRPLTWPDGRRADSASGCAVTMSSGTLSARVPTTRLPRGAARVRLAGLARPVRSR